MLVLSRKKNEAIVMGEIVVRVLEIRGHTVRLGFEAPDGVSIVREELLPLAPSDQFPQTGGAGPELDGEVA